MREKGANDITETAAAVLALLNMTLTRKDHEMVDCPRQQRNRSVNRITEKTQVVNVRWG